MTVYQQILNVYPDEFEGRDINKIKESIQKVFMVQSIQNYLKITSMS